MDVVLLKDSYPVARKEHRCSLCGGVIKPGEKYHRQTLVYDGSPYEWVEDLDCHKATDVVCERLDFFGYDREDGLTGDVFDAEIVEILRDDLGVSHEDVVAMNSHERVLKVLEHYDEILNDIRDARHEEYKRWKQREAYRKKRVNNN